MSAATPLTQADFDFLRQMVRRDAGIVLEPGKEYLVETRLAPVARDAGLTGGLSELVRVLRNRPNDPLRELVKDAMTTNETSFYRDIHPFESLKTTIIPDLIQRRAREQSLSIWCAASSSGQEPFSFIMMLKANFPELENWRMTFDATDLSKEMVERCQSGRYSQLEVNRGLPAQLLVKYFTRDGADWVIKPEVRNAVRFQTMNLIEAWPSFPPLDIVFIRNVLIYFDTETKRQILAKIKKLLRPDGYLMLGASETTINLDEGFERVQLGKSAVYKLRGAAPVSGSRNQPVTVGATATPAPSATVAAMARPQLPTPAAPAPSTRPAPPPTPAPARPAFPARPQTGTTPAPAPPRPAFPARPAAPAPPAPQRPNRPT